MNSAQWLVLPYIDYGYISAHVRVNKSYF